jgi:hypothetical protein
VLFFKGSPGCPQETYPEYTVSEQIITPNKTEGEKIAQDNLRYGESGNKTKKEHKHPFLQTTKKLVRSLYVTGK